MQIKLYLLINFIILESKNKSLKYSIYQAGIDLLEIKKSRIEAEIEELMLGLQQNTKSSAGDKHETARAMAQLEQEKASVQLVQTVQLLTTLNRTYSETITACVTNGSLVTTQKGIFYLSIALGKINVLNKDVMVISIESPLGKAFLGKKIGEEVGFKEMKYKILEIG